jgi:hypothetical protein
VSGGRRFATCLYAAAVCEKRPAPSPYPTSREYVVEHIAAQGIIRF